MGSALLERRGRKYGRLPWKVGNGGDRRIEVYVPSPDTRNRTPTILAVHLPFPGPRNKVFGCHPISTRVDWRVVNERIT